MENIFYKISSPDNKKIDLYVSTLVEQGKYIKQLGVCAYGDNDVQLNTDLDINELDSLIKYLKDCREYIEKYNSENK